MKKTLFIVTSIFFIFIISSVSAISWSGGGVLVQNNITNFTQLLDTPSSYSGEAGNCAKVNGGETGLEFGDCGTGGNGTGITNISQAGDVNVSGVSDGDVLKWNDAVKKFIASTFNSILSFRDDYLFFSGDNEISFNETKLNETGDLRYWNIDGDNTTGIYNVNGIMNVTNLTANTANITTYFGETINITNDLFIKDGILFVGEGCSSPLLENNSVCIGGTTATNSSIIILSNPNDLSFAVLQSQQFSDPDTRITVNTLYNNENNLFCDFDDRFTIDNRFDTIVLLNFSSPNPLTATGEITEFINSSCVIWVPQRRSGLELSSRNNFSYVLNDPGIIMAYDNGAIVTTGENPNSKFSVNFKNTSETNFIINFFGSIIDQIVFQSVADIRGQNGFINGRFFSKSSNDLNNSITKGVEIEIDQSNFNGGKVSGLSINILNKKDSVDSVAISISSDFSKIIQTSKAQLISKIFYDDTVSTINVTGELNISTGDTPLWENNGSVVYIGNTINFTKIEFTVENSSNENIGLVGSFCNSSGWFDLDIVDDTSGMQISGTVEFLTPITRGTCNFEIDGTPFADDTNHTYIALQRTNAVVAISPTFSFVELLIDSSILGHGNIEGITGAEDTFWILIKELLSPGEPAFGISYLDETGATKISSWFTSRANETSSGNSNSFIIVPDNDLSDPLNMTETANAVQRYRNYFGTTSPVDFDSNQNRTSLFVLFAMLGQQMFLTDELGNGLLRVEGDADIILRDKNTDMDVIGGPMHLRYFDFVIEGVALGANITIFNENFESGTMGQFSNNFWLVVDTSDCPNHLNGGGDFCAENSGVATVSTDIAEFSSSGFNITNLTIDVTAALDGAGSNDGLFQLYMDNNEGDESLIIEIDTQNLVDITLTNLTIPSTMYNKSIIDISIEYTGTVLNQINIDNIVINAVAIEDTTSNQSRARSHIKLLDGDGNCDIFAEDIEGISHLNITCDNIHFIGNVTETSVTEITLNITDSLTVANNVTIGGWFNGLFNWTTLTNWLSFDGATLSFNETKLNETIDIRSLNETEANETYLKLDSSNSPLHTNDLYLDNINVSDANSNIKWGFENGEMYIIG